MRDRLCYKGYTSKLEYSVANKVIFGHIDGIDALYSYEAENPNQVEQAFRDCVDDYIDARNEAGIPRLGSCPCSASSRTWGA